ncbi:MAG: PEP-CTERM sorting domain-containing protein [Deltaproteobacteria bacterium]|nr:PEP-CTERM sorting domain-containing protein [Deltaproteobacteria bacterium]
MSGSNFYKIKSLLSVMLVVLVVGIVPSGVLAVSLDSATTVRSDFSFGDNSFDGPNFTPFGSDNLFQHFDPFTDGSLLEVDSFTGGELGQNLELFNLAELASFDGYAPAMSNSFGFVDSSDNFLSLLNAGDNPGASAIYSQASGEELTFALQNSDGTLLSVDSRNEGNAVQMLGTWITEGGNLNVPISNLHGFSGAITFDLMVGDLVLFIEDLKPDANHPEFGVFGSDFDYNDFIVVVRGSPIPEPSTVVLFALALGTLLVWHRGANRSSALS